jgi:hypothetical protein
LRVAALVFGGFLLVALVAAAFAVAFLAHELVAPL